MAQPFAELAALRDAVERLQTARVDYMLTGSMAMNYYAEPRMTRDLDIVVAIGEPDVARLAAAFGEGYYVDPTMIRDAIRHRSIANVVELSTMVKVDLIPLLADPWSQEAFARRRTVDAGGFSLKLISAEDLVLAKLRAFAESGSEQQQRDLRNLLRSGTLDRVYLARWVRDLALGSSWEQIVSE